MDFATVSSGIRSLDEVLQGLRLGDNVVWQVDSIGQYQFFAEALARAANASGTPIIYLHFAAHEPVLEDGGAIVYDIDPGLGFDAFTNSVHRIIERYGVGAYYVFDNLSALVSSWATDELVSNFFQVTCPYLRELETVAYFALFRHQHDPRAVARIRDTTQLLLDVFHLQEQRYLHPIKVWDRYTSTMFMPHLISEGPWIPLFHSGDAALVCARGREKPLQQAGFSQAPWDSVYHQLFQSTLQADYHEDSPDVQVLKYELTRMLIGSHPKMAELADTYLTVQCLLDIRDRLIGSGQIGGKAAGMVMARRILLATTGEIRFGDILEDHDSFYIGSNVFYGFLVQNKLFRLKNQLSRAGQISKEEFVQVEQEFLAGSFTPEILSQLQSMLDYFGQAPIIVRSSSLLEDSFGNAFAGKYRSEFCPNQGSPETRLANLIRAIKLVYASTLNPNALAYRRQRSLSDRDEQMAILVQRVSGTPYKHYFFPCAAGVGFSRNLFSWSPRIDAKKGLVRLVFGLGTRAVDRVGDDFPRMFALSHPLLRPESSDKVHHYSQHQVDVLDLKNNEFCTVPFHQLVAERDYPGLANLVSVFREDYLDDHVPWLVRNREEKLLLTFNPLIAKKQLVTLLDSMLANLEKAYGLPVDTEFTVALNEKAEPRINLVQCRPMWLPKHVVDVTMPTDISQEDVLFRSDQALRGGVVSDIRYLLYIDPHKYQKASRAVKQALGPIVGRINSSKLLQQGNLVLLGPGRWGSSNLDLGVNVGYADINNVSVLVEIARVEGGHRPEVSYGTHFFQDLVEAQIIYLPLYPDASQHYFNEVLFAKAANHLGAVLPEYKEYQHVVTLVDLFSIRSGMYANVAADPISRIALAFLNTSP